MGITLGRGGEGGLQTTYRGRQRSAVDRHCYAAQILASIELSALAPDWQCLRYAACRAAHRVRPVCAVSCPAFRAHYPICSNCVRAVTASRATHRPILDSFLQARTITIDFVCLRLRLSRVGLGRAGPGAAAAAAAAVHLPAAHNVRT